MIATEVSPEVEAFDAAGESGYDPSDLLRVLEITRRLAGPYDLHDLLGVIVDAARDVLRADRGTVFLYDDRRRELYAVIATGAPGIRFSIDRGIAGECARLRELVNVPDCHADARFNTDIDRSTGYVTRALLALPLVGVDGELVGVMQVLNPIDGGGFGARDERLAAVLAAQAADAIQRVTLLEDRTTRLKLERDLALARRIQRDALPKDLPDTPGYTLAATARPAEQTGGDIYDVVSLRSMREQDECSDHHCVAVLLADATGHGIGPALSVTPLRAMLRVGLRLGAGANRLFRHMNQQLCDDLPADRFVTAFVGILDPECHTLEYQSAGQAPILHYKADANLADWHDATTMPFGLCDDEPDAPAVLTPAPGDVIALLTDGFYEHRDADGQEFGRDGVLSAIRSALRVNPYADGATLLDAIFDDIATFCGVDPLDARQEDDMTAVVLRRNVRG